MEPINGSEASADAADNSTRVRLRRMLMAEKNLKELFLHTLKDVYFAEHEILKACRRWHGQRNALS